jgi:hypothetical protein
MRFQQSGQIATIVGALCIVGGCASTQLGYNTVDIGNSVDRIITSQVLDNFGRFIGNPYAIPSMITLTNGTVQTQNSVTPMVTDPLSSMFATTNTVANVTKGATTTTGTIVGTVAGRGLTVSANDQWMQSWTTNPIIENHILRRLRALFRYATIPTMTKDELICEYAIVTLPPPGKYTIPCTKDGRVTRNGGIMVNPDPDFITRPGCVICESLDGDHKLVVNEKLKNEWLNYQPTPIELVTEYSLGLHNGYLLYLNRPEDIRSYEDFILFVLEATVEQAPASAAPTGGSPKGTTRQNPAKPTFVPDAQTGREVPVLPQKNIR